MNLGEEISSEIERNPDWKRLPYEYASMCIAVGLTFAESFKGFNERKSPEEVMFEVFDYTPEQIEKWNSE